MLVNELVISLFAYQVVFGRIVETLLYVFLRCNILLNFFLVICNLKVMFTYQYLNLKCFQHIYGYLLCYNTVLSTVVKN